MPFQADLQATSTAYGTLMGLNSRIIDRTNVPTRVAVQNALGDLTRAYGTLRPQVAAHANERFTPAAGGHAVTVNDFANQVNDFIGFMNRTIADWPPGRP